MAITREQALKDGVIGGCPLIDDREKLDFDTIIGEAITVEDFAKTKTKDGEAYAIIFEEYPDNYAWAGGWLKKMIETYNKEEKRLELIAIKTSEPLKSLRVRRKVRSKN